MGFLNGIIQGGENFLNNLIGATPGQVADVVNNVQESIVNPGKTSDLSTKGVVKDVAVLSFSSHASSQVDGVQVYYDKQVSPQDQQKYASQIQQALDNVPPEDRQSIHNIYVGGNYSTGTFQVTQNGKNLGDIFMNTADLQGDKSKYVFLHEVGHAVAIRNGVLTGSTADVWHGPDIANQEGEGNLADTVSSPSAETFAAAYGAYYGGDAQKLQQFAPDEYNAIASGSYRNPNYSADTLDEVSGGLNSGGEWVAKEIENHLPLLAGIVNPAGAFLGAVGGYVLNNGQGPDGIGRQF